MPDLIISVQEARKIIGKTDPSISDEELEKMILDLYAFAKAALSATYEKQHKESTA